MREGKRSVIGEQVRQSRQLMEDLVQFRNLYWLTEVTFRPQGAAIYQRFRQGLGSAALFEAVSAEVSHLQSYYESFLQRGTNTLVNLLTFIGVPLTVMTSIYTSDLFPEQGWPSFLVWLAAVVAGGWLVLRLFQFALERRKVRR
jgi:Mg2+ and Co2+ transporter CorA